MDDLQLLSEFEDLLVRISATPLDETSAGTTGFAGFDRCMGLD
jgi:hypothetical protein